MVPPGRAVMFLLMLLGPLELHPPQEEWKNFWDSQHHTGVDSHWGDAIFGIGEVNRDITQLELTEDGLESKESLIKINHANDWTQSDESAGQLLQEHFFESEMLETESDSLSGKSQSGARPHWQDSENETVSDLSVALPSGGEPHVFLDLLLSLLPTVKPSLYSLHHGVLDVVIEWVSPLHAFVLYGIDDSRLLLRWVWCNICENCSSISADIYNIFVAMVTDILEGDACKHLDLMVKPAVDFLTYQDLPTDHLVVWVGLPCILVTVGCLLLLVKTTLSKPFTETKCRKWAVLKLDLSKRSSVKEIIDHGDVSGVSRRNKRKMTRTCHQPVFAIHCSGNSKTCVKSNLNCLQPDESYCPSQALLKGFTEACQMVKSQQYSTKCRRKVSPNGMQTIIEETISECFNETANDESINGAEQSKLNQSVSSEACNLEQADNVEDLHVQSQTINNVTIDKAEVQNELADMQCLGTAATNISGEPDREGIMTVTDTVLSHVEENGKLESSHCYSLVNLNQVHHTHSSESLVSSQCSDSEEQQLEINAEDIVGNTIRQDVADVHASLVSEESDSDQNEESKLEKHVRYVVADTINRAVEYVHSTLLSYTSPIRKDVNATMLQQMAPNQRIQNQAEWLKSSNLQAPQSELNDFVTPRCRCKCNKMQFASPTRSASEPILTFSYTSDIMWNSITERPNSGEVNVSTQKLTCGEHNKSLQSSNNIIEDESYLEKENDNTVSESFILEEMGNRYDVLQAKLGGMLVSLKGWLDKSDKKHDTSDSDQFKPDLASDKSHPVNNIPESFPQSVPLSITTNLNNAESPTVNCLEDTVSQLVSLPATSRLKTTESQDDDECTIILTPFPCNTSLVLDQVHVVDSQGQSNCPHPFTGPVLGQDHMLNNDEPVRQLEHPPPSTTFLPSDSCSKLSDGDESVDQFSSFRHISRLACDKSLAMNNSNEYSNHFDILENQGNQENMQEKPESQAVMHTKSEALLGSMSFPNAQNDPRDKECDVICSNSSSHLSASCNETLLCERDECDGLIHAAELPTPHIVQSNTSSINSQSPRKMKNCFDDSALCEICSHQDDASSTHINVKSNAASIGSSGTKFPHSVVDSLLRRLYGRDMHNVSTLCFPLEIRLLSHPDTPAITDCQRTSDKKTLQDSRTVISRHRQPRQLAEVTIFDLVKDEPKDIPDAINYLDKWMKKIGSSKNYQLKVTLAMRLSNLKQHQHHMQEERNESASPLKKTMWNSFLKSTVGGIFSRRLHFSMEEQTLNYLDKALRNFT